MPIGLDIGLSPASSFISVTSSPDGVLTMPKGALAIDTSTGVTWRNEDGGTQWWPTIIPPRAGTNFECDFNGATEAPLSAAVSGGGTSLIAAIGNANAVGIARQTVTAVADRAVLRSTSSQGWLLFGLGATYGVWRSSPSNAEDGTDRWSTRIGFGDADSIDFIDGAYFEADRNTYGDNFWRICTSSNSVRTKVALATGPVAAAYQRLRVRVNAAATAVDFWINDVWQGQITTNIPSGVGRDTGLNAQVIKSLGPNARNVDIDYAAFAMVFTTAR